MGSKCAIPLWQMNTLFMEKRQSKIFPLYLYCKPLFFTSPLFHELHRGPKSQNVKALEYLRHRCSKIKGVICIKWLRTSHAHHGWAARNWPCRSSSLGVWKWWLLGVGGYIIILHWCKSITICIMCPEKEANKAWNSHQISKFFYIHV